MQNRLLQNTNLHGFVACNCNACWPTSLFTGSNKPGERIQPNIMIREKQNKTKQNFHLRKSFST